MVVRVFLYIMLGFGFLAGAPNQNVKPIKGFVYNYFDIEISNLKANNGENYRIFQAIPKGKKSYKNVIYMLDANAQFPMILNLYRPTKEPPLIIAIGYDTNLAYDRKRRTRDYTPKTLGDEFVKGGGADLFYKFIKEILMPFVEFKFDTKESQKTLYGHSFGGLFTLFAMLKNEELFDDFFIASPSLWWGDSLILKEAVLNGKFRDKIKAKFVNLSIGELEKRAGKTDKEGLLKASNLAEILRNSNISYRFKIYKNQTHGSVIPLNLQDLLKYYDK
ncbi:alpha/beta hydrolase-fold protein [Campylobacter sp. RM16190]|uniref:alpha/beta hydrolase n=1 Tax=Campylobacter sp. RM16190 TaxID=1705727 RepID=UPI00201E5022|nr:alpha/beta hydrolase-fold protein [Campylobacter sp. RM16190]